MSKLNGESQTVQILFVYLHGEEGGGEKVRERANNTFPERMLMMMTMVGVKQLSVAGVEVVVF